MFWAHFGFWVNVLLCHTAKSPKTWQGPGGFVDQSAHAGTAKKQVTHFWNLNITHASLKLDGVPTDKEIKCDFGDWGDSTIANNILFDFAFRNAQKASHGVSLDELRTKLTNAGRAQINRRYIYVI